MRNVIRMLREAWRLFRTDDPQDTLVAVFLAGGAALVLALAWWAAPDAREGR